MNITKEQIEAVVQFVLGREEHYTTEEAPLTDAHAFGEHSLVMRERKPLLPRSQAHLDQRIKAITSSAVAELV